MDLKKQIYATCFNPQEIKIINPVTREPETREVPCGKCYHCRMTLVNEWVTRMCLETMYHKYCYFVTLTYGINSEHTKVFAETYPRWTTYNTNGVNQNTPLVLRKSHLQKFFKRLRKNTGIKFKYFACGEYGHKFGRPHYHIIFWSDDPISKISLYRAWSTIDVYGNRKIIGNIDFHDLMENGTIKTKHSFKYVCKYLQKKDFDFNQLPTKDLHRNLKLNLYDKRYYAESIQELADGTLDEKYRKAFGPFMLCSKSPAIGAGYLYDNIDRFQEKDFRLFGVPDKSLIFPRYFLRKTKEVLCPFKCISKLNGKPTSSSGVPDLATLLVEIQTCLEFNEGFLSSCQFVQIDRKVRSVYFNSTKFGEYAAFPWKQFNFYNSAGREYFLFAGNKYITLRRTRKGVILTGECSVQNVIDRLRYSYGKLLDKLLLPFEDSRVSKARIFDQMVRGEFGSKENYERIRKQYISALLSGVDDKQVKYYNSKIHF